MSTELILIRHGQTVWNSERRMQGQRNSALSALGRAQARALARRMQSESFDHLYSSDLDRALETAQAIAETTGHEIRIDARLRERSFVAVLHDSAACVDRDPSHFLPFTRLLGDGG